MQHNFCPYCMHPTDEACCPVCGGNRTAYRSAPHHLQPGTLLSGKYVIGSVLGEGGFGITYIGRDINLDVRIAIKEYFPSGVVNRISGDSTELSVHVGEAADYFENGKQRFLGEARTLAKFSGDPGIVSVRDFFSENNTAYIVMEYLDGVDLKDYLRETGKMSFSQTVSMLTPIMRALSKIHGQGLIHRDISPANIMVLKDGTVKLLDFGAAREVGGPEEKSLSILLKPGYAPEEQYRTKGHQGPWTDVYALSATMYRMLTGKTPADAMNRLFADELIPISQLNPTVTAVQEGIVRKGMALQKDDRYQTVDALCDACIAGTIPAAVDDEMTVSATVDGSWIPATPPPAPAWTPVKPAAAPMAEPVKAETPAPEKTPAPQPAPKAVKAAKPAKRPNVFAFIGAILTGLLTMYTSLFIVITIQNEESFFGYAVATALLGAATVLLGSLYFPRLNNKARKPNIFCLVLCILSLFVTGFFILASYVAINDGWLYEDDANFSIYMTVLSLIPPVFFGYFFFPRLKRKLRILLTRIGAGIAAVFLALFVGSIVFRTLGTVTIGDQNIKRDAQRVYLSLDVITNEDLAKLTELKNMEELEIVECFLDDADMELLGQLTQLKKLSITANTDVTDVSPLAKLTGLEKLDISNTQVTDISPLAGLTELTYLDISNTKIKSLAILEDYTQLTTLYMSSIDGLDPSTITMPASIETLYCESNDLPSLEFLTGAENLYSLMATRNQISDLTPLAGCAPSLLDLSANNITDISPLDITNLWSLDLSTNRITDISPLADCKISSLDLAYNQIVDLTPLAENTNINVLTVNNNRITDISPLKDCFHMHTLDISYNEISGIDALATVDDLKHLTARGNAISDISPLAKCATLIQSGTALDLRDNEIVDIQPLALYTNTSHFYLSGNRITNISPLAGCTALEMLKLSNNQVTDISPIYDLPQLYILEVVNNPVSSLEGFRLLGYKNGFDRHATFRFTYHEAIDYEALSKVTQLRVTVYNVPPRQVDPLKDCGFFVYENTEELDTVPPNYDIDQEEGTEETTPSTEPSVTEASTEVTVHG